jgi:hypothetical protein
MKVGPLAVLLIAGLIAGGCHSANGPAPSPPPRTPSATPRPVVLSVASPVALVPVDPVASAHVIRLNVVSIVNPGLQAIALDVSIANGGDTPKPVGTVSPFPADNAGGLSLALTGDAKALAAGPMPQLTIKLTTLRGEALGDDVRVAVSAQIT